MWFLVFADLIYGMQALGLIAGDGTFPVPTPAQAKALELLVAKVLKDRGVDRAHAFRFIVYAIAFYAGWPGGKPEEVTDPTGEAARIAKAVADALAADEAADAAKTKAEADAAKAAAEAEAAVKANGSVVSILD